MTNKDPMYFGITIGPIYASLLRTATPAGLWFVSTMFSRMSEEICKEIVKRGVEETQIFAPYHVTQRETPLPEGVGLYHDRILFCAKQEFAQELPDCIAQIKQRFADYFKSSFKNKKEQDDTKYLSFIQEYVQIYYVYLPVDQADVNPMDQLNKALDIKELQTGYLYQADDMLTLLLAGDVETQAGQNEYIKNSFLMWKVFGKFTDDNRIHPQIQKPGKQQLFNILDIAEGQDAYDEQGLRKSLPSEKHRRYWALVNADGDCMGRMLGELKDMKKIRAFSRCRLEYGAEAAERIQRCGGITIYAGGDDLLFLAPTKDILQICEEISESYCRHFVDFALQDSPPTISFGVQICFYCYPLYEALTQVSVLLQEGKERGHNRIALSLQKSSGREIRFDLIHHDGKDSVIMKVLLRFLNRYIPIDNIEDSESKQSAWLQSVLYTVARYRILFVHALEKKLSVMNLFNNLFYQEVHQQKGSEAFLKDAVELLKAVDQECAKDQDKYKASDVLETYDALLRYVHFYLEKGEKGWGEA